MNTRSQDNNDNLDVTEEVDNDKDFIDESISHENAGTGLPDPTGVLSLGELNAKQSRIIVEVDQLQKTLGEVIGGQVELGENQDKLQVSVTELTSSLSSLEGAQTNTRGFFEEELNRKASILEMRTKIDEQGERLMTKIEGINQEIIRIETDMRTDDSKVTGFGNSINKLDEETKQIKKSIRSLKQEISTANRAETDLWDDFTLQIGSLAAQVRALEDNTAIDELKASYEGRLTNLERIKRQDNTGSNAQENKIETKTRTLNALQATVGTQQDELNKLKTKVEEQKSITTSNKDKIIVIEGKVLAMDEILKTFSAEKVRLLKVESEQESLEGRIKPRITSIEDKLEDLERIVTEIGNDQNNEYGNNVESNVGFNERIRSQGQEIVSMKGSLASLKVQIDKLKEKDNHFISEIQLSAFRSKVSEFELNQQSLHSELMKLTRSTISTGQQRDLNGARIDLELDEIKRQVGLLNSETTTNTEASSCNDHNLDLAQRDEKINLIIKLLWENLVSEIEKVFTSEKLLQNGVYNYPGLEENREEKGIVLIEKGKLDFIHTVYSQPTQLVAMVPRVIVLDDFNFKLKERGTLQYGAIDASDDKNNCKEVLKKQHFFYCENNSWGKLHECAFSHLTDKHDACTFIQLNKEEINKDKEETTVLTETDNKLVETIEVKTQDKENEVNKKDKSTAIKNIYFLNAQTLRVEINEWKSKHISLEKIVGLLDHIPWNAIGIVLSIINLLIFVVLASVTAFNYFKEVKRILKEKERERENELEMEEMDDLLTNNTYRNSVTLYQA